MCRVPGGVTAALAIEVTKHRATLAAARPVVAGVIVSIGEECRAVGHDASENIVPVCRVAPTKYAIAILIERSASDDIGAQVQVINIFCDKLTGSIVPRPVADPTTRVGPAITLWLGAEICDPGLVPRPSGLCQVLTMRIGTFKTTKITAITWPCTYHNGAGPWRSH